jgi:CBS domain-containing protein
MMAVTNAELQILVSSVMQPQSAILLETDTIQDAVDKMSERHLSALAVVNTDGVLVGILTLNDLLRLVQETEQSLEDQMTIYENCSWLIELIRARLGDDEVTSAMSCSPVTVRQDETLTHVAQLMLKHQVHHIPVTDRDKKLVGMVSSFDFVRIAADGLSDKSPQ